MMFPLGLGNDICHVPRIYRILASRHGPRFVARVLTPAERQDPRPRALLQRLPAAPPPPPPGAPRPAAVRPRDDEAAGGKRDPGLWEVAVFMAGRFAAKEAAIKAHPHRRLTFQLVRVQTRPAAAAAADTDAGPADARSSGPPVAVIRGDAPGRPDTTALLSISHDGDYAAAVCLAVRTPDGDGGDGGSSP